VSAIDVVVPCYNYARFLKGCVGSVLSQRDVEVRVLIVDDASSDDTPAVAQQLAAADQRVSYVRNTSNLGLVGTANKGVLEWASAPYTLLLSADDALTPGSLARSAHVLDAHPEAGMVYGMARIIKDDHDKVLEIDLPVPTYQIISGRQLLQHSCEWGIPAPSPTVVVRTSLQHRLGGYCPHLPHACDMEMWMRFATQGPVGVIKNMQAYYREHGENMSLQYCNRTLGDSRQQIDACREVFDRWCTDLCGFDEWMKTKKRRLCDEAYWHAGRAFEEGDHEGVAMCLAFAREHDPRTWRSPAWWKFRTKALLGRHLWNALAPWVRRASGRSEARQVRTLFGWWPDIAAT
jgi:glycosyltransferase involved in cell wall biosynthesis